MDALFRTTAITLLIFCLAHGEVPPETCDRESFKKVGCYHDRIIPSRPLPLELVNHRDSISNNWDGHLLSWKNWSTSLKALACACAEKTRERGFKYFGLQFYGECWSGDALNYYRDGASQRCIDENFKPCDDKSDSDCVGKAYTNYIYEFVTRTEKKVDGNWSSWSEWTSCSASCSGGSKVRERQCNEPEPANGGEDCEGDSEEEMECNMEECAPVCEKPLEIGVILDASTSVTRANWKRMIHFVKTFTEDFDVSEDMVHFGAIRYAWGAELQFKITDKKYWDDDELEDKIDTIHYTQGGTRTDLALRLAREKLFCKTCGLRPGVSKLLIVITDGKSNVKNATKIEAGKVKALGVNVIAVGVGKSTDLAELNLIATHPTNVFRLTGFGYFNDKANNMLKASCRARAV